jgi:hypothetical protein
MSLTNVSISQRIVSVYESHQSAIRLSAIPGVLSRPHTGLDPYLSRTRSFIRFSELNVLIIRYDKMVSHMMPHVH